MALRREIAQAEKQLAEADARLSVVTRQHFLVKQERLNTEENLAAANVRLKNLLGELQLARKEAKERANMVVQDKKMTMGELTRNVETTLKTILDEKFGDERFVAAITEQTAAAGASTDRVRVEFEGDEVFWSLQDNYTFENLLVDASRYWDLAHQDAFLVDERGAIWPNDGYVGLELQRTPNAKIALKIKPVATTVDDDVEVYGHDGDESEDFSEEDFDQGLLAIAVAAEDELLLAQAKGQATALTNKQKLAIRRKLKFEMYYFLIFVVVRTLGLCLLTTRRALASRPSMPPLGASCLHTGLHVVDVCAPDGQGCLQAGGGLKDGILRGELWRLQREDVCGYRHARRGLRLDAGAAAGRPLPRLAVQRPADPARAAGLRDDV